MSRFREALEQEFGVGEHPKANLLWEMAWERGISGGLHEVYMEYMELVE